MTQPYDEGDGVRLSCTFKTTDGVAADPTDITVWVKKPRFGASFYSYATSPPVIIRTGVGEYYMDLNLDQAGVWRFKWIGSGALIAAEEGQLFVRRSSV